MGWCLPTTKGMVIPERATQDPRQQSRPVRASGRHPQTMPPRTPTNGALVKRLFAAVAMIILFLMPATMAHASTPQDPQFPPPDSTSWGTSVMPYGGETYPQALARSEQQLAPQLIRFYNHGGDGPSRPPSTGTPPPVLSFKLPPPPGLDGPPHPPVKNLFSPPPPPT